MTAPTTEALPELIRKTGAANNRGNSKQDYETPWEFIRAVESRFGPVVWDLAATKENAKGLLWISEEIDSLASKWSPGVLSWLNPPFGDIAPWAKKCAEEAALGARILLLTPASVDSNWWRDYIHGKAWVEFLSPRISFDGKNSFPKPCTLSCFNVCGVGYGYWRWKP